MGRINKIRQLLPKYNLEGYLIPSTDKYLGEYTTERSNRLKYITNFSGSNGLALITKQGKNYFFTDGRYLLQAEKELEKTFEISLLTPEKMNVLHKMRVGFNAKIHSEFQIRFLDKFSDIDLVGVEEDLAIAIWEDRPPKNNTKIFLHENYSGESSKSKIEKVTNLMIKDFADYYIISDPHAVCWLLNIRARDLQYTPLVFSFAILDRNGQVNLFCDNEYDENVESYFANLKVCISSEKDFFPSIMKLLNNKVAVGRKASAWMFENLPNALVIDDYCDNLKSIKNSTEIKGAISAHKKDAKAVRSLLRWIDEKERSETEFSELDVVQKLLEFRSQQVNFICPSFATIAGFNANGAIIHYKPEKSSNLNIKTNGILLIDSGGQYLDGTTDITRTIAIGKPTEEQIHNFTLILKGVIAVSLAKFPMGTTGEDLDKLARQYLLAEDKDYAHGTGHGVGSFLSVHEGPQAISKNNKIVLKPGMILSIEPGFYKEGEYGIRIENLAYVKESDSPGCFEFETLTCVPLDRKLIDMSMLSEQERCWLREYLL